MLTKLFPRDHRRYSSLCVLGPLLEGYAAWLYTEGFPRPCVRQHLRTAVRLERALHRRGARGPGDICWNRLLACAPADTQGDVDLAALVRSLGRYLVAGEFIAPPPTAPIAPEFAAYGKFLIEVRGLARLTAADHVGTASRFMAHLKTGTPAVDLAEAAPTDIEGFLRETGARISRATLQHVIAQLRGFLRFLAMQGLVSTSLHSGIDTPRLYRDEQLPRSLPWDTVRALLSSIDRSTPRGRRDYAILLLIATYGLRSSDVVALRLEDLEWGAGRIRVGQHKTGTPLLLPLTDEAGEALADYMRHGRPALGARQVFLRARAPAGILKPTAVCNVFQTWARKSRLAIPFHGAHCLRHSFAVHLLRQGTALKTIGDLLGHRTAEATCVYLRLAVEDLRDVALPLPALAVRAAAEGRP